VDKLFDRQAIERAIVSAVEWFREEVLTWGTFYQVLAITLALALAFVIAPLLRNGVARLRERFDHGGWTVRAMEMIAAQALPLVWLGLQWIFLVLAEGTRWGGEFIEITVSLLAAWVVIQFASLFIRNRGAARLVRILVWSAAALNILGLLQPTIGLLDAAAVDLGGFRLSVIVILKALLLFTVLLWAAMILSQTIERRVATSEVLSPSIRVLTNQLVKIGLVTLALVASLASVGVDLTAFAVFTGALGVGIGFGLQKVVANLISGILLLVDHSIKPGDVIAVEQTYGWVNFMGARYVSVITRDGTEHLIPNETLVTTQVENWSYSDNLLRLRIPIGVSYKSDLRKAIALVIEAAAAVERVLDTPAPVCLVKGFGDSSVDLEARLWISDPRNGISNVKSEVLLQVWDRFHSGGIEIPFPQRDLHLKSTQEIPVVIPDS
jgi:small-conductance mechanosensitive channel